MSYQFYVPTRILFGTGMLNELHSQTMPGKKAMVVISNGKSMKTTGILERVLKELLAAGVETAVFDKVQANPLRSTVMEGAAFARENSCDFVVALGGGSVMDASKAMAAMVTNYGDIWDYMFGGTGGGKVLINKALPVICITTTAGTGAEVDQWGVITNDETNEKIGFGGYDCLFPVLSVVDPELMVSVPAKFTAYQGFDALFHSTECYISKAHNLMGDMLALTAIENIGKYLVRAVKDGSDLEAREGVAFANNLSGQVMDRQCLYQRTFHGTRYECISSGTASRRRSDYDFCRLLSAFCGLPCLRRAIRCHGKGTWQSRCFLCSGLCGCAGTASEGLRRGRP